MKPAARRDLVWILVASALILALGSLPTWMGHWAETAELRFRGLFFDPQDYAVHIAMMEAGIHGEWGYTFRFTSESVSPAYLRLFYVILGHLSRLIGLSPEPTYHLARWLLGFVALYALYRLMRHIFPELFWARTAFLLAALGSGLGWLQLILDLNPGQITPIDFWLIDAYVFFSLSLFPHFAFVIAAMATALMAWLIHVENPRGYLVILIAVLAVLVQFTNPIAFAVIDAALLGAVLSSAVRNRSMSPAHLTALGVLALIQVPLLVYNLRVLGFEPYWSQFTAQNLTPSPAPIYYLLGFTPLWPLAASGTLGALRRPSPYQGAAVFWIVAAFALAYVPFPIQRRFLQGITIPLAILATDGLRRVLDSPGMLGSLLERRRRILVILFVFLASLSSIQIALSQQSVPLSRRADLFYPSALDDGIRWLRNRAHYQDVVLASEATSQVVAQRAGVRVYFGHEMETLDFATKRADVSAFYEGRYPDLVDRSVQWVVYGPEERILWPEFRPPGSLDLVFDRRAVQIYRVK